MKILKKARGGAVFVVDKKGAKIGYITLCSVLKYVSRSVYSLDQITGVLGTRVPYFDASAEDVMETMVMVNQSSTLEKAMVKLINHQRCALPVVENGGKVLGIVCILDVLENLERD